MEDTIKCVSTEEKNEKHLAEKGNMASLDAEGNHMEDKATLEKSLEERIKNLERANKDKKQNIRALVATPSASKTCNYCKKNGQLEMECW